MKELLWIGVGLLVLWWLAEPSPYTVAQMPGGSVSIDIAGVGSATYIPTGPGGGDYMIFGSAVGKF